MLPTNLFIGSIVEYKDKKYFVKDCFGKPILEEILTQEARLANLEETVSLLQKQINKLHYSNPIYDRRSKHG